MDGTPLTYPEELQRYLENDALPGVAAQRRLAPVARFGGDYDPMPPTARRAAVLMLLFPSSRTAPAASARHLEEPARRGSSWHAAQTGWWRHQGPQAEPAEPAWSTPEIVLIERPHDGSPHAGEIALPGGAHEGDEAFPQETALREAWEEVGVPGEFVTVLGALTPLYVPVSNFSVVPIVGAARELPDMAAQPEEVAAIHTAPLATFGQEPTERELHIRGEVRRAPGYLFGPHFIWGATAMMLAELVEVDRAVRARLAASE
jgi:8-oxo-dGTP pyrophosphatase MutT (NUDIX family)